MIAALLEFVIYIAWDLFFSFIFYSIGALLLRLCSFGKLKPPLWLPKTFREHKDQIDYLELCYLLGIVFCAFLVLATVGTINLNG